MGVNNKGTHKEIIAVRNKLGRSKKNDYKRTDKLI
jgi:hypothetical protein